MLPCPCRKALDRSMGALSHLVTPNLVLGGSSSMANEWILKADPGFIWYLC